MSYLEFDKTQLVNLEYSLSRETIRTNRAGSYACSTIIGCNTRKYHGLLVCPIDQIDGNRHVLLSSLDATLVQQGNAFHLGIHKYPGGVYSPQGHKYILDFDTEPIPRVTYQIGSVILVREILLVEEKEQILVRYTLQNAGDDKLQPARLELQPLLAFRSIHTLTHANISADTKYRAISNGIKMRLYPGYPELFMQVSRQAEFVAAPDWHYNIEYSEEQKRGYDYQEDLFRPGYFEVSMREGDSVVFSAALEEVNTRGLNQLFNRQVAKRIPRDSYENCLINSAQQFFVKQAKKTRLISGFPWFGEWGRDTFIALPGLTLSIDDEKNFKAILNTASAELKDGLFPNMGTERNPNYNSADAPLWYFWTIQQYYDYKKQKNAEDIWKTYGKKMQAILKAYRKGTHFNIHMSDNHLIYAGEAGKALTWMDAVVHGKPVTPRTGWTVEVNALWYNAVCFALEIAKKAKDEKFVKAWSALPEKIAQSFVEVFWYDEEEYLADYVNHEERNLDVRPNQVFATSLPYSPLEEAKRYSVLELVRTDLLTPRGLRSLSPQNAAYRGVYQGDQSTRDLMYHQGCAWPWLATHFMEGYLRIHGKQGLNIAEKFYKNFEEDMEINGLGSISEIYDGNPPHQGRGAISQAWSVGEILRLRQIIQVYKRKRK